MSLIICPGCKQNASADDASCVKCGFDLTGGPDVKINRAISALALAAFAGAVITVFMLSRTAGAHPSIVYDIILLGLAALATCIARVVLALITEPQRNRW